MGILDFVDNKHAGIIPRALAQIFDHVREQRGAAEITITISFLQLYRETIQDLLAPGAASNLPGAVEENLNVREDPSRGFYGELYPSQF